MRAQLLFLLLAAVAPLSASNLVVNGTFDTDCSAWTPTNVDGSFCQNGLGGLGPGNPGGWVSLNNAPGDVSMFQAIAGMTIGAQYTLTWDMQSTFKCCGSLSSPGVSVAIDGNTYLFTIDPAMTWTSFSRTFTFSGGSNALTFSSQINGTDQDAGFDNIAINAAAVGVPEPSTFFLITAGLAAILLRRRA